MNFRQKINILLQIKLIRTLFHNAIIKGDRSVKMAILLFKKGVFKIHKTARINIYNGKFLFNQPFNVIEPFPSLLEMRKNSTLDIKNGFQVHSGCHIIVTEGATLRLGSGYINRNTKIKCYNNIDIGENVVISENCTIWDSDVHTINSNQNISLPVKIGDHVWIGTNCIILKGVTIGNDAVIAAGSLVNKNVPSNVLVGGVPAKILKENINWI